MNSLIVFGGGGFVGGNLVKLAQERDWCVTVIGPTRKPAITSVDWRIADIADEETVDRIIQETMPTAVVNLAAIADIDRAERERELAWSVNVLGAAAVARSCGRLGIKYVFSSSDAVFDGERDVYREEDAPNPVNYYGRTKAEAEQAIFGACPEAAVTRTSLVLGYPVAGGNAYLSSLDQSLKAEKHVVCSKDELRTPIDVITLSRIFLELATSRFSGLVHVGGTQSVSRYELTRKLASEMAFDVSLVLPGSSSVPDPGRAPRHSKGVLDVSKAQQVLKQKLPDLDQVIHRAISRKDRVAS